MSELRDILQEEVLADIEAIRAEAESRADKLVREAKEEAAVRLSRQRQKMEAEARAALRRAESAAELTLSNARMQAKGQVIESVRKRALAALEEIAGQQNYGTVLQELAEEALRAVGAAGAVIVHPGDMEELQQWAAQRGLELRTDPGLRLGVRVMDTSGKGSVENSLLERLDRAWSLLASDVAKQLWG